MRDTELFSTLKKYDYENNGNDFYASKELSQKSSCQLYKNISPKKARKSIDGIDFVKNMMYPPPPPLNVPIQKKIHEILELNKYLKPNDLYEQKMRQTNHPRTIFTVNQMPSPTFQHPKKKDLYKYQNRNAKSSHQKNTVPQGEIDNFNNGESKIKSLYLKNYKQMMKINKPHDIRNVEDHPLMVEGILFSQLSAGAVANHNWRSVLAKRRVLNLKNHPNIDNYPHSPRTMKELNHVDDISNIIRNNFIKSEQHINFVIEKKKKTKQFRSLSKQEQKIKATTLQTEQDLILNTSLDLDQYLSQIVDFKKEESRIYNKTLKDYNHITDYAKSTKLDNHKFNIEQADADIQFIQSQKIFMMNDQQKRYKEKANEKLVNQIEKDNNVDTDSNYKKMPFYTYQCWLNDQSPPKPVKLKRPQRDMETEQVYVDGGFDEQDSFLIRPVKVPRSKLNLIIHHEEDQQ